MKEFLEKLQISDNSIELYIKSLGKPPLTYYEIHSLTSDLNQNEFTTALEELINEELFVRLEPQTPESLLCFLAIPPFKPILNYYENIENNIPIITEQVIKFVNSSLNKTLMENKEIEMNTLYNQFLDMKKDIDEDNLIQKLEVEEIVETFKELDNVNEKIDVLQEKVKLTASSKFTNLIRMVAESKNNIVEKIQSYNFKKVEDELIKFIEDELKTKIDQLIDEFTSKLNTSIDEIFSEYVKPITEVTDMASQARNDYKMLFLSGISNFEIKLKKISDTINFNKSNMEKGFEKLKLAIMENIKTNIQNSINQISNLNKPIEGVVNQSFQKFMEEKPIINNLWLINSMTKLNEEIVNIIGNSKFNLQIMVPNLEQLSILERLQSVNPSLNIKISSSDAQTNSHVQKIIAMKNIKFKTIKDNNLIAVMGDNKQLVLAVIQGESTNPLYNCIGFVSNNKLLITALNPIFEKVWAFTYATPTVQSKFSTSMTSRSGQISDKNQLQTPQAPVNLTSTIQPKKDDELGNVLNQKFNSLLQQLDAINGKEFGKNLQDIADFILETKGYSVTLHSVRSQINKYKNSNIPLTNEEKHDIFESIENWKQKLL